MMRARGAMTRRVVTVQPETPIFDALNLMREHNIRHLPVMDSSDRLVGIVSEGDLLLHSQPVKEAISIPSNIRVEDIMTKNVISCTPQSSVADVAATMITCKIDCIPVQSEGRLVGILSTTDILELYCVDQEMNGQAVMPLSFTEHRHINQSQVH